MMQYWGNYSTMLGAGLIFFMGDLVFISESVCRVLMIPSSAAFRTTWVKITTRVIFQSVLLISKVNPAATCTVVSPYLILQCMAKEINFEFFLSVPPYPHSLPLI